MARKTHGRMISTPVQQHSTPRVLRVKFLRTSAENCARELDEWSGDRGWGQRRSGRFGGLGERRTRRSSRSVWTIGRRERRDDDGRTTMRMRRPTRSRRRRIARRGCAPHGPAGPGVVPHERIAHGGGDLISRRACRRDALARSMSRRARVTLRRPYGVGRGGSNPPRGRHTPRIPIPTRRNKNRGNQAACGALRCTHDFQLSLKMSHIYLLRSPHCRALQLACDSTVRQRAPLASICRRAPPALTRAPPVAPSALQWRTP